MITNFFSQKPVVEQLCLVLRVAELRPLCWTCRSFVHAFVAEKPLCIAAHAERFLHATPTSPSVVWDLAYRGSLDIVKYLHWNDCTASAMQCAAYYGRVDIIEWLYENRNDAFSAKAMECAANCGNLAIVKWLYVNGDDNAWWKGYALYAFHVALKSGHLKVVQWLVEKCGKHWILSLSLIRPIDFAVENGHLEVAQYLHATLGQRSTLYSRSLAEDRGYHNVAQWARLVRQQPQE